MAESYRRAVKAVEPSAYLHSWRVLGHSGSVVYGIYCDRNCFLSAGEPSGPIAWREAARKLRVGEFE